MFKTTLLTAALAALLSTSAHADPAHYTVFGVATFSNASTPSTWTGGQKLTLRVAANLTSAGIGAGMSGTPISLDVPQIINAGTGTAIVLDSPFVCSVISTMFLNCEAAFTPKSSDKGVSFTPRLTIVDSTGTKDYTSPETVSYVEPPFDDSQHANVEGVLTSHPDRKIRKAGEVITFAFNVSDLTRSIPAGDYIRTDITAADIVRPHGTDSNQDFGFTCESVGAGVPVGGGFRCSGAYTVKQTDIDAENFMLAFGATLSVRDFNLWGGFVMENFEVAKEETPKPETPVDPETPEKTACKPMPVPAGGARFVFRYPTGSACS